MSVVENLPYVEAELNYLAPTPPDRPRYNYDTGPGEPFDRPPLAAYKVRIHNLRPLGSAVDLDREPPQQRRPSGVDPQVFRLVDDLRPCGEVEDSDASPAAMGIG